MEKLLTLMLSVVGMPLLATSGIKLGYVDFSTEFYKERAWAIRWAFNVAQEEGFLRGFNFR